MSYSKGWVIRLAYAKHFLKSHSEKTSTLSVQKTCIARLSLQTEFGPTLVYLKWLVYSYAITVFTMTPKRKEFRKTPCFREGIVNAASTTLDKQII